jgi:hypothetical protein
VVHVAGVSSRESWSAEITDGQALIEYAGRSSGPGAARRADQAELARVAIEAMRPVVNRWARERKGTLDVPGVKAVQSSIAVSSSR